MLVLSRKKDESIIINDNIVITVVEIRGDKVRLGIKAPREIPVHRSEIYAVIQAEKAAALVGAESTDKLATDEKTEPEVPDQQEALPSE